MPTVITINRINVFVCTLLHGELYNNADTYLGQIDFFSNTPVSVSVKRLIINRCLEGKDRYNYTIQVCYKKQTKQTRLIKISE